MEIFLHSTLEQMKKEEKRRVNEEADKSITEFQSLPEEGRLVTGHRDRI